MNKQINKTNEDIKYHKEMVRGLEQLLLTQWGDYIKESIGINVGDKVQIKLWSGAVGENGIFVGLKIEYGRVRPIIKAIKKDGTAHSTSTIYCYDVKDMKKPPPAIPSDGLC